MVLECMERKESVLFMVFVHAHSDANTFCQFFGHMSTMLRNNKTNEIRMGSDAESAMRGEVKHFFPNSLHVSCTLHLKDNTERHVKNRRIIVNSLFGSRGLSSHHGMGTFEGHVEELKKGVLATESGALASKYVVDNIIPLLKDNLRGEREK